VVNTPVSYSWSPGFKSHPGDRLSWLRYFVVFSVPKDECWHNTVKIGQDPLVPLYHSRMSPLCIKLFRLLYQGRTSETWRRNAFLCEISGSHGGEYEV
jgi:hypothetical protein